MYRIDFLRSSPRGAPARGILAIVSLLLALGLLFLAVELYAIRQVRNRQEQEMSALEQREEAISRVMAEGEDRIERDLLEVEWRGDRILWKPLFAKLSELLPSGHWIERIVHEKDKGNLYLEVNGTGDSRRLGSYLDDGVGCLPVELFPLL